MGGDKDYDGKIRDVYSNMEDEMIEDLMKKIEGEVMEEVMRRVSSELMDKLAPYLGEDAIKEMLNTIDVFGEKGNELLSDSVEVYEAVGEVDSSKLTGDLGDLAEETTNTLIVGDVATELAEAWNGVQVAEDSSDLANLADEIKGLLDKNEEASVKGDEAYKFYDVEGDQWYYKSVMSMKEDGVVNGYSGDKAGNYGPGDNVTIAETLKMAFESAGIYVSGGSGAHWAEQAGYVKAAGNMGLDALVNLSNLDKAATREEVAVIIAEVYGFDISVAYDGVFPDYNGGFGGHVQAMYDAGIFTGEGDTGNFNGNGLINRAAMAKVVNYSLEAFESENFVYELEEFDIDEFMNELKEEGGGYSTESSGGGGGGGGEKSKSDGGGGYGGPSSDEDDLSWIDGVKEAMAL